jgi:hypothetical protein
VIVAALLSVALAIRIGLAKMSQRKRQLEYRNITNMYSEALKAGSTREIVEAYLRSHGKSFQQSSGHTNAWDDLVRIGQERGPWYCDEVNVYVVFVFDGPDRLAKNELPSSKGNDNLVDVELLERAEGCM